jgi:N-acetylglucosamine-6-sulfatase
VVFCAVLVAAACLPTEESENPGPEPLPSEHVLSNIVFILAEDLEAGSEAEEHMGRLRETLTERGVNFENAFVSDSICCPSRAAILLGQYTHNHEIRGNSPPAGGL